jgi:hypothetical protein
MMSPTTERLVFLCYSRRDVGIVRKLQAVVRAAGMVPWRDEDAIDPGSRWRVSIVYAIASCERVLVFWCGHASRSDEVRREYWSAINEHKLIVPIRLDGTKLPTPLVGFQATDVSGLTRWSHTMLSVERWLWIGTVSALTLGVIAYALA